MRDGKPQDATVTIGDRDKVFADMGQQQSNAAPGQCAAQPGEAKLGIVVHDVSPQTAAKLHTPGRGHPVGALRLVCRPAGA